jgi:DNA uptake protein ComE-like DNA-binding protein
MNSERRHVSPAVCSHDVVRVTPRSVRARRGSVLIVVLWVSLGLVSIALLFGHSMLMTYRGADNDIAGRQADLAIEGAVRYAESLISSAETPGVLPDVTTYENEAVPVGEATFWMLGRTTNQTNSDGTTRDYGLIDESSKLNLNAGFVDAAMLRQLPGMTETLANAIVEWRTAAGSNQQSTSTTTTASTSVKQAPFESIEELALVTGATREILSGEDANLNGALDTNEDDGSDSEPVDNSNGRLDPGIFEYVTVFSRESNKQSDGTTDRINLSNLAQSTQALTTMIDQALGDGRAAKILPLAAAGPPMRSVLEFYFRAKGSNLSAADFAKIAYEMTTNEQQQLKSGDFLVGLINVNTASETVMRCLPGMDTNTASQIVTARLNQTTPDANYAWLVDEGIVKAGAAPAWLANITGKSSQYMADVAAVGRNGRGYRRTKFVIDASGTTPRIIYRRNLAPLGWALGSDVRELLASLKSNTR